LTSVACKYEEKSPKGLDNKRYRSLDQCNPDSLEIITWNNKENLGKAKANYDGCNSKSYRTHGKQKYQDLTKKMRGPAERKFYKTRRRDLDNLTPRVSLDFLLLTFLREGASKRMFQHTRPQKSHS
jgi:hypothetical protein